MPTLDEVVAYCDRRTRRAAFVDYPGALNGLQVANEGRVTRIGAAVDAGAAPFAQAVAAGVDFLVVHHGLFWGPPRPVTGAAYRRLSLLLHGGCALYSSHLPLDAHPEIGNNALLARELGLRPRRQFLPHEGAMIGWIAPSRLRRSEIRRRLAARYPRFTAIECGAAAPRVVAFCSGHGRAAVDALAAAGADTLVTGELPEECFSHAQDHRLNLYCCGHYATEVHGVRALAAAAARRFRLPWEFIATENPL